jgi:hypothetical protein
MKISIRKMFVLLAVVMSLVAAQAVWAHVESVEGPYTVEGTVAYVWGNSLAIACGYTMEPDAFTGCPLMISEMGPAGWWSVNEMTFPAKGAEVIISIYKVTTSVGDIRYVAGEVIDNGEGESILLHIPVYNDDNVIYVLDPAWSKMEPLAEATISSTAATDTTDCTCGCNCKNDGDCTCICDCVDCIDCDPVGDEHQYKKGTN